MSKSRRNPRCSSSRPLQPRRRRLGWSLGRLEFEILEYRSMLAVGILDDTPQALFGSVGMEATAYANASDPSRLAPGYIVLRDADTFQPLSSTGPVGLTPAQIRHAYGFDQITFGNGSIQGDGTGQTIAIVDAYDAPTIASDLHNFDLAFGLPDPPSFTRVAQDGSTNYPAVDPAGKGTNNWEIEEALDVEWAHAISPSASIVLVEATSNTDANLISAAVNYVQHRRGDGCLDEFWTIRKRLR